MSGLESFPETRASVLPQRLLVLFGLIWGALAIAPVYRNDWLLENVLVFVALPLLVWTHRRFRFSDATCVALFVFAVLHEIGAHYTYAEVPWNRWMQCLLGLSADITFGFSRNHYDRAVHFLYGLLVTPAALEIIDARATATPLWRWLLTVTFMASHSVLYELLEWAAVLVFASDLGMAYLGTQGDEWDAHQDMLLALLGTLVAATFLCLRGRPHRS